MNKVAIIHIGAPKTGTTSIQTFCYQKRQVLLDRYGIYYPDHKQLIRPESGYGHHYLAFHMYFQKNPFYQKITPNYIDLKNTFEYLKEAIVSNEHEYLLLSCEALFHSVYSDKFEDFLNILKQNYNSVNVILYIRRQDELILSAYATAIRMKIKGDINQYIKTKLNLYDFYKIIKSYESYGLKVFVNIYEQQKNIVEDFLKILGEIIGKRIELPATCIYKNQNPPWFVISLMAKLLQNNAPLDNIFKLEKLGYILKNKLNIPSNYKYIVAPSTRQKILANFSESNRKLASEYLGLNNLWYNEKFEDLSDEEWNKNFKDMEIKHLCESIIRLISGG